ncbi:MAG: uracil-DNA glycosylase [Gemmatimonadetes bacterium]|nr:uracil-DNA glycosylase [Gemmatimonadota bacterium]
MTARGASPRGGNPAALARLYLEQAFGAEPGDVALETMSRGGVLDGLAAAANESTAAPSAHVSRGRTDAVEPLRPGPSAPTDDEISAASTLEEVAALVGRCTRCELHASRGNPVPGAGPASARVVCVGEAPGKTEDETGLPFVGRAGQLLDRLLMSVGMPRESVFVCNVLKSRPPRNRDPLPPEIAACNPFLLKQLSIIGPRVIVAFGAFAARTLLDTSEALGRLRDAQHSYAGYPVVVTYHPAALLRNPSWTRLAWEDLQKARALLEEDEGAPR